MPDLQAFPAGPLKAAVMAAVLLLPLAPAAAGTTGTGPREAYVLGLQALERGEYEQAADLLIEAAREDKDCLVAIAREQDMLPESCEPAEMPGPHLGGDPAPFVLYRLALHEKAAGGDRLGRAGKYFLERIVRDHAGSPWEDDAALMLIQQGFCLVDAGYPECVEWEIRGYEQWLKDYPLSDRTPEVMLELARDYLELAKRLERDGPWNSPVKAELCRGRAFQLAHLVEKKYPGSGHAETAARLAGSIRDSGRPYSIVPPSAIPAGKR